MAYRDLRHGDLVRVVDKSEHHGLDGVVLDVVSKNTWSYVQLRLNGNTDCKWIKNDNLLVRNSSYHFVVDGRIDHEAKRLNDEARALEFSKRNNVDIETECDYDYWDRESLIERIKELEEVVKQF